MSKDLIATENMLDVEKTVVEMFDAVRENVAKSVTTVEAADALISKLSEEAASFNDCLTNISNAIHKFEAGEFSREEMMSICAPCVKALKEKCSAIQLGDIKTTDGDITEEEIALLREYIVGCKDIVIERKAAIQKNCCAQEGLLSSVANMSAATEAAASSAELIRRSPEAKTAAQLYKQAKSLYGYGSKDKANEYLKKAQSLYEKCLAKVEKGANMYEAKRTMSGGIGNDHIAKYSISDTYTKKVTDSKPAAFVIAYFEDRIDSCKALALQWNNKAGNKTFKETKAQLKEERKAAKHAKRLERAKNRAGKKAANKMSINVQEQYWKNKYGCESLIEDAAVLEALADTIDFDYAMESNGAETTASEVSPEEEQMRAIAAEMNRAEIAGDEAACEKALNEFNKLYDKVKKQAADAYTEDDLKAADRKLAKCIAIGASVVVGVAGLGILGSKTGAFKKLSETATDQITKLKETKGTNKTETKKALNLAESLKNSLHAIPSKIKGAFKKKEASIESYTEFFAACESIMDTAEMELAMEATIESDTDENSAKSPATLGTKIRSAFAKLRKAKTDDNSKAVKEANREIVETANEISEAYDEAKTPEEKKRLSKTAKIALASAATVAAMVGATVAVGKRAQKTAENDPKDVKGAMRVAVQISNAVVTHPALPAPAHKALPAPAYKALSAPTRHLLPAPARESILDFMITGLESFVEYDDDDKGRYFDGDEMMMEAEESDLDDISIEATVALMAAEDGIVED